MLKQLLKFADLAPHDLSVFQKLIKKDIKNLNLIHLVTLAEICGYSCEKKKFGIFFPVMFSGMVEALECAYALLKAKVDYCKEDIG